MEITTNENDFISAVGGHIIHQQLEALSINNMAITTMLLARAVYSTVSIYIAAVHCKADDFALGMLNDLQLMQIIEPAFRHYKDPEAFRGVVIKAVSDLAIANTLSSIYGEKEKEASALDQIVSDIKSDNNLVWLMDHFILEPNGWNDLIITIFYERMNGISNHSK